MSFQKVISKIIYEAKHQWVLQPTIWPWPWIIWVFYSLAKINIEYSLSSGSHCKTFGKSQQMVHKILSRQHLGWRSAVWLWPLWKGKDNEPQSCYPTPPPPKKNIQKWVHCKHGPQDIQVVRSRPRRNKHTRH